MDWWEQWREEVYTKYSFIPVQENIVVDKCPIWSQDSYKEEWYDIEVELIDICNSKHHGPHGLITTEKLTKNQFIGQYTGELISIARAKQRASHKFMIGIEQDGIQLYVDGSYYGNMMRYVNHSCFPNSYITTKIKEGLPIACLFTYEQIKQNTEITVDYFINDPVFTVADLDGQCMCGTQYCRCVFE